MLFAIGIRHVGETVAKKIARSVGSMARLADLDQQALVRMEEVGPVIAESIAGFFAVQGNRDILQQLQNHGVRMELDPSEITMVGDKLKDKTFVVSGVFRDYTRDSIKEAIEHNGGKVSDPIQQDQLCVGRCGYGPGKAHES